MALLFQQVRGDRRVNATAEADDNSLFAIRGGGHAVIIVLVVLWGNFWAFLGIFLGYRSMDTGVSSYLIYSK